MLNGMVSTEYTGVRKLARNAGIGFCSSFVSDCFSNGMRVVTVTKQSSKVQVGYAEVARSIIKTDGVWGLVGRGLGTKILSNGISAMLFSVMWRRFTEILAERERKRREEEEERVE